MIWRIVIAILIIISLVIVADVVFSFFPPKIDLEIKKVRTQLKNDTLYLNMELNNDLLSGLSALASHIRITSFIDTLKMAEMTMEREQNESTPHNIEIPGMIPLSSIGHLFDAPTDSVQLRVYVDISKEIPAIGYYRTTTIKQEMTMVKPRAPQYSFEKIESFSLKKDSVHFIPVGYLYNPNSLALTVLETDLHVDIDDRFSAAVLLIPPIQIPPHDSVLVSTVIGIQDFQLIKDGFAVVFGFNPLPYTVTGNITIELDSVEVLAPVEMEIIHTGKISLSPFAGSQ